MTREETVELWRRCDEARATDLAKGRSGEQAHEAAKQVWNTWAEHLGPQRQALEESRQFAVHRAPRWETEGHNDASSDWLDRSAVIFCDITFRTEVSFQGFIFPGVIIFGHVDTRKTGDHLPASFSARIIFVDAVFC
ncbi:MAG TPA: hypothetical protein VFE41_15305 [Acetobacteraceae bacterium]|nr:hypothetical protein [Acetobacteraceae bacterium]